VVAIADIFLICKSAIIR